VNASFESWLIDEALTVVDQVIAVYKKDLRQGVIDPDLGENIRIELRRFFERNIGKKPTVVPMIMDV
jgi:mRNA degradation ribonuclease J1/J2